MKITVNDAEDSATVELSFADTRNHSIGELVGKMTPTIQQLLSDSGREKPLRGQDSEGNPFGEAGMLGKTVNVKMPFRYKECNG